MGFQASDAVATNHRAVRHTGRQEERVARSSLDRLRPAQQIDGDAAPDAA